MHVMMLLLGLRNPSSQAASCPALQGLALMAEGTAFANVRFRDGRQPRYHNRDREDDYARLPPPGPH